MRNNKNNITLSFRNIISFLKILTVHLTGVQKIITLSLIILMLSFTNIIFNIVNISALSYSSSVGIGFTFNPTLSVSLSSSDLVIPNLVPGSTLDSNSINVSVATNASHGYTLSATVGDSTHDNSNLTHSNNTNVFSSIAIDADLSSLDEDEDTNIWGYSYRNNITSPSTWSNYNGLSSFSNAILLDNNGAANSTGSIDFKIGAKASSTQASGTYTGTINFIAVTKIAPMSLLDSFIASGAEQLNGYYKMQDMTHDICESVDVEESELQLIDVRDNKVYWVAKLKDGNCWMTQNLDLAGGIKLFAGTSDVPENSSEEHNYYYRLPESSHLGFSDNTKPYVYNSDNLNCLDSAPCSSYYSWIAATAGSGENAIDDNGNASYSICPRNWRLPTSGVNRPYSDHSDFYNLSVSYGMNKDVIQEQTQTFFNQAGPGTAANIQLAGYYDRSSNRDGQSYGYYWSSTPRPNVTNAYGLYFSSSAVYSASDGRRMLGASIRCLAR